MTEFKGKKITVMGLGLLGRAIGDVRYLAESGASLIVTDLKTREALAPSLAQLEDLRDIQYVLGGHRLEDFRDRDLIVRSADVKPDSPFLAEARAHGIPVKMSTSLFAANTPATLVGVTGTRGKSTTTQLIYETLSGAFRNSRERIFIGGNVRGVSTLPLLGQTQAGDIAVLELDSWQLQGFGEERISPHIAVFTTFFPDHQNYYRHDMDAYLADKANIFLHQSEKDVLIASEEAAPFVQKFPARRSTLIVPPPLDASWTMRLRGRHNRENVALAVEAARQFALSEETIRQVVADFAGVPGRLEKIAELNGVEYYNDTTATTPDAVCAALEALGGKKNIILIMGGADKELDMSGMLLLLPRDCKLLVVLPGTGTDTIRLQLSELPVPARFASSMREAVDLASREAAPGDIVLLSPGFASFGLFQNEFDRGDQFVNTVRALT